MKFDGKFAVVTGGTKGIGYAIVKALASQGANVIAASRNAENGKALVNEAAEKGWKVEYIPVDLASQESINALFDAVEQKFGKLDIYVNSVGVADNDNRLFQTMTKEQWDYAVSVEVTGTFLAMQRAGQFMEKQAWGRIVNITSIAGITSGDFKFKMDSPAYAITNGAMNTVVKTFSRDLARFGTTVNAIAPGIIETDRIKTIPEIESRKEKLPVRHFGKPEDIAACVEYLCGENSGFITGQVIDVNGGALFHY